MIEPDPAGEPRPSHVRTVVWTLAILGAVVVVTLLARPRRLESVGEFTAGPGPLHTMYVANRGEQPCTVRVIGRDDAALDLLLHGRARGLVQVPSLETGNARIEVRTVLAEGPGCVERSVEWTTVAGEELRVTIEADGTETRETLPTTFEPDLAGVSFRTRTIAPVLVHYEDLAAAGGKGPLNHDGQPVPEWLGPGVHTFTGGTSLQPGVAVRLRYQLTTLSEPVRAEVDAPADGSHEVVVNADGSIGVGGVSLLTRTGF